MCWSWRKNGKDQILLQRQPNDRFAHGSVGGGGVGGKNKAPVSSREIVRFKKSF